MKTIFRHVSVVAMFIINILLTGCFSSAPVAERQQYYYPDWAPEYYPGVRYYYIPDIETYYDLSRRSFVYFDRGQWIYSSDLPPMYRNYDLYNGYEIALDRKVYEPWRYHQNYISSYPRYYYRNVYHNQNTGSIRGYNENVRKPVYSKSSDRARRNETSNSSVSPGPTQANPAVTPEPRQSSSVTNRRVGTPVKVTPEMRRPSSGSPSQTNGNRRQAPQNSTATPENKQESTRSNAVQPPSQRRNSDTPPSDSRQVNDNNDRRRDRRR